VNLVESKEGTRGIGLVPFWDDSRDGNTWEKRLRQTLSWLVERRVSLYYRVGRY